MKKLFVLALITLLPIPFFCQSPVPPDGFAITHVTIIDIEVIHHGVTEATEEFYGITVVSNVM